MLIFQFSVGAFTVGSDTYNAYNQRLFCFCTTLIVTLLFGDLPPQQQVFLFELSGIDLNCYMLNRHPKKDAIKNSIWYGKIRFGMTD